MTFPTWLVIVLVTGSAVDAYLLTQTTTPITGVPATVLGAAQVAIAAVLGFQKGATNTVRRLRGKPTIA